MRALYGINSGFRKVERLFDAEDEEGALSELKSVSSKIRYAELYVPWWSIRGLRVFFARRRYEHLLREINVMNPSL